MTGGHGPPMLWAWQRIATNWERALCSGRIIIRFTSAAPVILAL
jgi:hypothetical protein